MTAKKSAVLWRTRLICAVTGVVASAVVLALMQWARDALQIRTLAERIMEAVLLLIPPSLFEGSIERFGPAAKDYALSGTEAAMFLALAVIGGAALLLIRRPLGVIALGVALWLFAMVVLMPLTGGGLFATALFQNPLLISVVYLGIGLAYACVLLLGPALQPATGSPPTALATAAGGTRRTLLAGLAAGAATLAATLYLGRTPGQVNSDLPLARLPTPEGGETASGARSESATAELGTAAPVPSETVTVSSAASATAITSSGGAATASTGSAVAANASTARAALAPTATAGFAYPEPPPERSLARDKDGALLAVNRPKGLLQAAVTPNNDFYIVTKNAGGDPRLEARDWRMVIDGAVGTPVQVDYVTLRRLPSVSLYKTLECISNLTAKCDLTAFGCDLISTARWTGVRLSDVLALAGGLKPGVVSIAAFGADEFSSSLPASVATDPQVILAYLMNDTVLPREHGFPVRLIVPNHYGYKSTKWLVNLRPMTQPFLDWYGQRNWTPEGIVKMMTRIDVPAPGATIPAGPTGIAGIAYAGSRGISKVEVSADAGRSWQAATLEPALGTDTFVRWSGSVTVPSKATIELTARAVDGAGQLQIEQFSLPQPSGGSGWNSITIHGA